MMYFNQGYDMSTYIRRYAKYLNEKAFSYRQMAFDFCKVKRGFVHSINLLNSVFVFGQTDVHGFVGDEFFL